MKERREIADAKCAWRKMDQDQRLKFLGWARIQRARQHISPEDTGEYPPCTECGNCHSYIGISTGDVWVKQPFTLDEDGEPNYDTWDTDDEDVGSYSMFLCGECRHTIWEAGL